MPQAGQLRRHGLHHGRHFRVNGRRRIDGPSHAQRRRFAPCRRQERLRTDLIHFLEQVGAANDEIRTHILESEKKNTAEHRHYSSYYTPELAELVSIRDRSVIERFGYVFEKTPAANHASVKP